MKMKATIFHKICKVVKAKKKIKHINNNLKIKMLVKNKKFPFRAMNKVKKIKLKHMANCISSLSDANEIKFYIFVNLIANL